MRVLSQPADTVCALAIADRHDVQGFPGLWIMDRQGREVAHHSGYGEGMLDEIIDEVNAILRQPVAVADARPQG